VDQPRPTADRILLRTAGHGGPWVVLLVVATVAGAVAELLLPAAVGVALDRVLTAAPATGWLIGCVLLIGVIAGGEVLTDIASGVSGARATSWLRRHLVAHVLAAGPHTTRRFEAGDLVSRIVASGADVGGGATQAVLTLAALLPAIGSVVALLVIDPWLAMTFISGMAVIGVLVHGFVRDATDITARYQRSQAAIAAGLLDALTGARTIAAAGTVRRECARVLAPLSALRVDGAGMWRTQTTMSWRAALVMPSLQLVVIAVAGLELWWDRLSPGELLAASRYAVLGGGLTAAVTFANRWARARGAAQRVADLLATPVIRYGAARLPEGGGRLEFRGVTAGDPPVLSGLDLTIPAGLTVAVVGRSGSGKSLLAALAGRLVDPVAGEVRLDGVQLSTVDRDALRNAVTYAFARPVLIGDTVGDAIALGPYPAAPAAVRSAARAACAEEFIARMPAGYATPLSAAPMSGGERQRVGLARAFAHPGRLLILDDATSSLDTATESRVAAVLTGHTRTPSQTRLVIAHRASTAARADLVAWLQDGKVRALAPHHQLWHDPDYRAVFHE